MTATPHTAPAKGTTMKARIASTLLPFAALAVPLALAFGVTSGVGATAGLITAIVSDARDNAVLMVAHMNDEALRLTQETGVAHFWSRSRNSLWKKGETSGQVQQVVEVRVDCDQDAVLLKVRPQGDGGACHVGFRSCFYRVVEDGVLVERP